MKAQHSNVWKLIEEIIEDHDAAANAAVRGMGQVPSQCAQLFGTPPVDQSLLVPSSKPANSDKKWDLKRLRAFILAGKLAPFLPSSEDGMVTQEQRQVAPQLLKLLKQKKQVLAPQDQVDLFESLEECPICMLHFQALNTSLCCQKRICTECYLQVQTCSGQNLLPTCPFCKLPGYVAKFQGAKTKLEREQDQREEQKVIESRIREREEERRCDEERELNRLRQQHERQQQAAQRASQGLPEAEDQGQDAPPDGAHGTATEEQTAAQAAAASDEERVSATRRARHRRHSHHEEEQRTQHSGDAEAPIPASSPSLQQQREREERRVRRHQLRSARRQQADDDLSYRVHDFLPSGIADVSVSVEDINELMLEQAMYESLRISMGSQQHLQQEQESSQQHQPHRQRHARQERQRTDRSASPAGRHAFPSRSTRRHSPPVPPTDATPAYGHRRSSYASTLTTDHSDSHVTIDPPHQPPFSPAALPEPGSFLLDHEVMGDSTPHAPLSTTPTPPSRSASHIVLPPQQHHQPSGSSAAQGGVHNNSRSRAALSVSLPASGTLPQLMSSPTTNTTFTSATSRTPQSTTPVPSLDGVPTVCAPWAETPSHTPTDPTSPIPADNSIAHRRRVGSARRDPSPQPATPRRAITTAPAADIGTAGHSRASVPRTATTSVAALEGGSGGVHADAAAADRRRTRSRGARRARHGGGAGLHDEFLLPPEARMSEEEAIALAIRQSLADSASQQPAPTAETAGASAYQDAPAPSAQPTLPSQTSTSTLGPNPPAPNASNSTSSAGGRTAAMAGNAPRGVSTTSTSGSTADATAGPGMQRAGLGADAPHAQSSCGTSGTRSQEEESAGGGNEGGGGDGADYEAVSGGEWAGQQQTAGQSGGSNQEQEEEEGGLMSKRMGPPKERGNPSAAHQHAAANPHAAGAPATRTSAAAGAPAPPGAASCTDPVAAYSGAPITAADGGRGGPFASVAGTPATTGGAGGDNSDAPTTYSSVLPQPSTADTALDSRMSGCSSLQGPLYEQDQDAEQQKGCAGGSSELLRVESNPTYMWSMTSSQIGTNVHHLGSAAKAIASPANSKEGSTFSASDFRASPTSSKCVRHADSPMKYQLDKGGMPLLDLHGHGHGQQLGKEDGVVHQQQQQQVQGPGAAPPCCPPPPSPPIPPSPSPTPPPPLLSSSPSLSFTHPCGGVNSSSNRSHSSSSMSLLQPSLPRVHSPDSLALTSSSPQTHQPPEPQPDSCTQGASPVPLSRLVAMASAAGVPGPAGIAAQQQREHGPPFVGMVHALWTGGSTQQQQQQELRQPLLEAEVQHPQQQSSRPPHLRDSLQQHQLQQDSQPPHPCTAVEVEVQQEPVETVPSNLPPLVAENPDGSVFMVVAAHGVPGGRVAADDGGFHCNSDGTRPAQRSTGIRAVEQERQHVGAPGASVGTGNDADNVVAPSTVEAYLLRGNMSSRTGGRGGADVGSDAGSLAGGAPHGGRPSSATTGDSAAAAARAQAQSAEEAHARAWEDELEAQQAAIDAQGYEDYDLGEDDGVLPTYVARGPLGSSCAPGSGLGSRADDERVRAATAAEDAEMRHRVALYDARVRAQESCVDSGRGHV